MDVAEHAESIGLLRAFSESQPRRIDDVEVAHEMALVMGEDMTLAAAGRAMAKYVRIDRDAFEDECVYPSGQKSKRGIALRGLIARLIAFRDRDEEGEEGLRTINKREIDEYLLDSVIDYSSTYDKDVDEENITITKGFVAWLANEAIGKGTRGSYFAKTQCEKIYAKYVVRHDLAILERLISPRDLEVFGFNRTDYQPPGSFDLETAALHERLTDFEEAYFKKAIVSEIAATFGIDLSEGFSAHDMAAIAEIVNQHADKLVYNVRRKQPLTIEEIVRLQSKRRW